MALARSVAGAAAPEIHDRGSSSVAAGAASQTARMLAETSGGKLETAPPRADLPLKVPLRFSSCSTGFIRRSRSAIPIRAYLSNLTLKCKNIGYRSRRRGGGGCHGRALCGEDVREGRGDIAVVSDCGERPMTCGRYLAGEGWPACPGPSTSAAIPPSHHQGPSASARDWAGVIIARRTCSTTTRNYAPGDVRPESPRTLTKVCETARRRFPAGKRLLTAVPR